MPARLLLELVGFTEEIDIQVGLAVLTIWSVVRPRPGWADAAVVALPEGLWDPSSFTRFNAAERYCTAMLPLRARICTIQSISQYLDVGSEAWLDNLCQTLGLSQSEVFKAGLVLLR